MNTTPPARSLSELDAARMDLRRLRSTLLHCLNDSFGGSEVDAPTGRDAPQDVPASTFTCNLCGQESAWSESVLDREAASCTVCGCTRRMREVVHLATIGLFGVSLALPRVPYRDDITGLGMSDSGPYADLLAERINYTNTWYHQEPRLDVTAVPEHLAERFDLVISSDVLEHVLPPVQAAFDGVARLLRPGGVFVLTVPCRPSGATTEHYPDAVDYDVVLLEDGRHVVDLRRRDGVVVREDDPVFHGGPGSTLEMRLFGMDAIAEHLARAGFSGVRVLHEDVPERGIARTTDFSLPVLAYR